MRRFLSILFLIIPLLAHSPLATFLYSTSWETGDRLQGTNFLPYSLPPYSYSCNVSTDYARTGTHSIRFELHDTDMIVAGNRRTELYMPKTDTRVQAAKWFAISERLPDNYAYDAKAEGHFQIQTGTTTTPFGPNVELLLVEDKYYVNEKYDSLGTNIERKYLLEPVTKGGWVDWLIHFLPAADNTGLLEVYRKFPGEAHYTRLFQRTGYNSAARDIGNQYPKFGLYKWTWFNPGTYNPNQRVTYQDDFRLGDVTNVPDDFVLDANMTAPVVTATPATQSITLPTNQAHIDGVATTGFGTITGYSWTQIAGPSVAGIISPTNSQTDVAGLQAGVYQFKFTATNSNGISASDTAQVIVNQSVNILPVARAGNDTTITAPASQANLNGLASTDADGTINTYRWDVVSGAAATITNQNIAVTTITGLVPGTYIVRLTVTDNRGGTSTATKKITVNPAIPPPNQPPVADAGGNSTATLPANTAPLNSSASTDPDGTIVAWLWTVISKPTGSTATITNASIAVTTLTVTAAGTYVIKIRVTDNSGDTGVASKQFVVSPAVIPPLQSTLTATNLVCYQNNTGGITSSTSGGVTPYTYSWTGPNGFTATTQNISSRAAGGYQLTVRDNLGSSVIKSLTLTEPPPITVTAIPQGTITAPLGTVSVLVSAIGGNTPYVSGTGTITNQVIGNHTYTVTDTRGCQGSQQINIPLTVLPALIVVPTVTNALCNNGFGNISFAVSGGTPPYTYLSSYDSVTTSSFAALAGSYTTYITDAAMVQDTVYTTVTEPPALVATAVADTVRVLNGTAAVTVSATGGTSPYTGTGVFQAPAGAYTKVVTDTNGCSAIATTTVPINIPVSPSKGKRYRARVQ